MPTNRVFTLFSFFLIVIAILLMPLGQTNTDQLLHLSNYHQQYSFQADPTSTPQTVTQTSDQPSSKLGGGNTILICGAAILVMIILGAVLFIPRPPNHAGE